MQNGAQHTGCAVSQQTQLRTKSGQATAALECRSERERAHRAAKPAD